METIHSDVLILGGGLAGLACAAALVGSGLRVVVLESTSELGGRARSCTDVTTRDRVDIGPHILLSEYRNVRWLLEKLGTSDRVVWQADRLITLSSARHVTSIRSWPIPAPLHLVPGMLKARDVSIADKISNARAMWLGMRFLERDVNAFDRVPADRLLTALGVSRSFMSWFWRSAAMSLMNVPLEQCSSGALMRFFALLLGREDAMFGFPACALDELFLPAARQLIEADGGIVQENQEAIALSHDASTCTGAVTRGGQHIRARFCVSAVPPAELQRILPEGWRRHSFALNLHRFIPSPYISTYLWFERKLTSDRFWANVWTPTRLNYDFYDLSNIRDGWGGRGSVITSNIIFSDRAAHLDDGEIVRITIEELAQFVPLVRQEPLVHHRVHRIPMAIPCPLPGTEQSRPPTVTDIPGLVLAGDWTATQLPCSMESAVRSGLLAAEHVLEQLGEHRILAQLPRPSGGLTGLVSRVQRGRAPLVPPT